MKNSQKGLLFFLLAVCSSYTSLSQKNTFSEYPDPTDEKYFFEMLYSKNGSISDPFNNLVKLNFLEKDIFTITSKAGLHEYCKAKYNTSDSLASILGLGILQGNKKLPISDTVYFSGYQKSIFTNGTFDSYRKLSVLDFLNRYVKRGDRANIFIIGYLFEKRILYDLRNEFISPASSSFLYTKYGLIWNSNSNQWEIK